LFEVLQSQHFYFLSFEFPSIKFKINVKVSLSLERCIVLKNYNFLSCSLWLSNVLCMLLFYFDFGHKRDACASDGESYLAINNILKKG